MVNVLIKYKDLICDIDNKRGGTELYSSRVLICHLKVKLVLFKSDCFNFRRLFIIFTVTRGNI